MASSQIQTRSQTRAQTQSSLNAKTQYLALYNLLSFFLWIAVFLRLFLTFALTAATADPTIVDPTLNRPSARSRYPFLEIVFPATWEWVKWTQTLALAEILHAALGLVRTSVVTTGMQVASRLLLIWAILFMFHDGLLRDGSAGLLAGAQSLADSVPNPLGLNVPAGFGKLLELGAGGAAQIGNLAVSTITGGTFTEVELNQIAYTGMLTAWSVTECIRYAYFVFFLGSKDGSVPAVLSFLRYNTFFVLYPLGISGECWLIYSSIPFARQFDPLYALALIATLAIYIPGSYILYTHMMAQRRKVMRGKAGPKSKTR